nr:hypothetical protein HK105_005826 [Polyrhizophydium stewartii]
MRRAEAFAAAGPAIWREQLLESGLDDEFERAVGAHRHGKTVRSDRDAGGIRDARDACDARDARDAGTERGSVCGRLVPTTSNATSIDGVDPTPRSSIGAAGNEMAAVRELLFGSSEAVQQEYCRIEAEIHDACRTLDELGLPPADPDVAAAFAAAVRPPASGWEPANAPPAPARSGSARTRPASARLEDTAKRTDAGLLRLIGSTESLRRSASVAGKKARPFSAQGTKASGTRLRPSSATSSRTGSDSALLHAPPFDTSALQRVIATDIDSRIDSNAVYAESAAVQVIPVLSAPGEVPETAAAIAHSRHHLRRQSPHLRGVADQLREQDVQYQHQSVALWRDNRSMPPSRPQSAVASTHRRQGSQLSGETSSSVHLNRCDALSEARKAKRMPLEWFDDIDKFEVCKPQEWLSIGKQMGLPGTPAFSRYYNTSDSFPHSSDWEWADCFALEYCPERDMYLIEWQKHPGSRKWVKRLNLLFASENRDRFYKRIEHAIEQRSLAELESEYRERVSKQPLHNPAQLPSFLVIGAIEKIGRVVTKRDFPVLVSEPRECIVRTMLTQTACVFQEKCLDELEKDYVFSIRRAEYHIKSKTERKVEQSTANSERFAALALAKSGADKEDASGALLNQVAVAARDLSDYMFSANSNMQKASIEILGALRAVLAEVTGFYCFHIELPCLYWLYSERAVLHGESMQVRLACEWPRRIATVIETLLSDIFDIRSRPVEADEPRCQSFLRLVNVIMETQLRNLVITGVKTFLQLFGVAVIESDRRSEPTPSCSLSLQKQHQSQTRSVGGGLDCRHATEMGCLETDARAPTVWESFAVLPPDPSQVTSRRLFVIQLTLCMHRDPLGEAMVISDLRAQTSICAHSLNAVVAYPDRQQLERSLETLLLLPKVSTTSVIPRIESVLYSASGAETVESYLRSLEANHNVLAEGLACIHSIIRYAWPRVDSLLERYREFEFLVRDDLTSLVSGSASLEELEAPVAALVKAQSDLQAVSPDAVDATPFVVDCAPIKRIFVSVAKSSLEAIQGSLSLQISTTCARLLHEYEAISERIALDPLTDAALWKKLQRSTDECCDDVAVHDAEVMHTITRPD